LLVQLRLESAVSIFFLSKLVGPLPEITTVEFPPFLCLKMERLGNGRIRFLTLGIPDWEQFTWLGVLDVALGRINREFVIESKDFSLSEHDFGFLLLL